MNTESYFLYMLKCSDLSYYIGITTDLEKRIAEHRAKLGAAYTVIRLPVQVVYTQSFASKDEAIAAERQLKGWSRKKKEAFLKNDWKEISVLSKKKFK
jgi:predicted GIY-YIG superfamily endonuclease